MPRGDRDAGVAWRALGCRQGRASIPTTTSNLGQSSNDVIPTAIRVSAQLAVVEHLLPALKHLRKDHRAPRQRAQRGSVPTKTAAHT